MASAWFYETFTCKRHFCSVITYLNLQQRGCVVFENQRQRSYWSNRHICFSIRPFLCGIFTPLFPAMNLESTMDEWSKNCVLHRLTQTKQWEARLSNIWAIASQQTRSNAHFLIRHAQLLRNPDIAEMRWTNSDWKWKHVFCGSKLQPTITTARTGK